MKAILRKYNDQCYVVKEVKVSKNNTFICDGDEVAETNVLSIIGKVETDFASCSHCGEVFPNTEADIAAHINRHKSYTGCFKCPLVRVDVRKDDNNVTEYTLNPDGTFKRMVNDKVRLRCGHSYSISDITNDDDRANYCRFKGCVAKNINATSTFFNKYSEAFDELITIDALGNFKELNPYHSDTMVRLRCRGSVWACVNQKGIVDRFQIYTRSCSYEVAYSKKYAKLFKMERGKYTELKSDWDLSDERIEYFTQYIGKLYN